MMKIELGGNPEPRKENRTGSWRERISTFSSSVVKRIDSLSQNDEGFRFQEFEPKQNQLIIPGIPTEAQNSITESVDLVIHHSNKIVDCNMFGALVSGGTVEPLDYFQFTNSKVDLKLGPLQPIEKIDTATLPQMQPIFLGTVAPDGIVDHESPNRHVVVKLPETDGPSQFISKLGQQEVVVTDLTTIAERYGASHIANIITMKGTEDERGTVFLQYPAPTEEPNH